MLMTSSALEGVVDRVEEQNTFCNPAGPEDSDDLTSIVSHNDRAVVITGPLDSRNTTYIESQYRTPYKSRSHSQAALAESKIQSMFRKKVDTVLVLGSQGCGKTTLVRKYIEANRGNTELQFIEVSPHDTQKLTKKLTRKVVAAFVIYDVNSKESISQACIWKEKLDAVTSFYNPIHSALIGNKVDLLTDVERGLAIGAETQRLAKKHGFDKWFIGSTTDEKKVVEAVETMVTIVAKAHRQCGEFVLAAVKKSKRQAQTLQTLSEEEVTEVKEGNAFIKYGRNGRPQLRILWVNEEGTELRWGKIKGNCSNRIQLSRINGLITGQRTSSFRKYAKKGHSEEMHKRRSFSLLLAESIRKTVDLIATSDRIYENWIRLKLPN
mmetsp:Transcript_7355/g.10285  ORF Transcript_7355/g.10285 Transcript_7355/m.10285 type:complete len:380 (+) Transcript_7355:160-1299(+)